MFYNGLTADVSSDSDILLSGVADTLETVFWQRETLEELDEVVTVEVISANPTVVPAVDGEEETIVTFSMSVEVRSSVWKR